MLAGCRWVVVNHLVLALVAREALGTSAMEGNGLEGGSNIGRLL